MKTLATILIPDRLLRMTSLGRRWNDDRRGTSTVTAAVTLPLFIVFLVGFIYLLMLLVIKWQLNQGTREAAQHLSEISRYWVITGTQATDPFNPSQTFTGGLQAIPADMYEREAFRLIGSRLRDLRLYSNDYLTQTLKVTVTEPALAYGPNSPPVLVGADGEYGMEDDQIGWVCSYRERAERGQPEPGKFFHHGNTRLLVQAQFEVHWLVNLPYTNTRRIVLRDRATGYVQCPRWTGQLQLGEGDKSFWLGAEGPSLPYRNFMTPSWPTVTPVPATPTPTPPDP